MNEVHLVTDQHGLNQTVYFARPEDARAYAERCSRLGQEPHGSYIVVPVQVWESLAARDKASTPEPAPPPWWVEADGAMPQ